jgi:hypothetical protein
MQAGLNTLARNEQKSPTHGLLLTKVDEMPPDHSKNEYQMRFLVSACVQNCPGQCATKIFTMMEAGAKCGHQIAKTGDKLKIATELLDLGVTLTVVVGGQNTLVVGQELTRSQQAGLNTLARNERASPEGLLLTKVDEMPPDYSKNEFQMRYCVSACFKGKPGATATKILTATEAGALVGTQIAAAAGKKSKNGKKGAPEKEEKLGFVEIDKTAVAKAILDLGAKLVIVPGGENSLTIGVPRPAHSLNTLAYREVAQSPIVRLPAPVQESTHSYADAVKGKARARAMAKAKAQATAVLATKATSGPPVALLGMAKPEEGKGGKKGKGDDTKKDKKNAPMIRLTVVEVPPDLQKNELQMKFLVSAVEKGVNTNTATKEFTMAEARMKVRRELHACMHACMHSALQPSSLHTRIVSSRLRNSARTHVCHTRANHSAFSLNAPFRLFLTSSPPSACPCSKRSVRKLPIVAIRSTSRSSSRMPSWIWA